MLDFLLLFWPLLCIVLSNSTDWLQHLINKSTTQ